MEYITQVKPWGWELLIEKNGTYAVKELVVEPSHQLSLQYHERKNETMLLVSGGALLQLEDAFGAMQSFRMTPFKPYQILPTKKHRLINDGKERVRVVEVSTTELDDIVRLEDKYGRS